MKHLLYWILAAISLSGCSVAKTPSDLRASDSDRTVSADTVHGELDRVSWTVTCGLPTRDNPLIDLLSTQFELPPSVQRAAGHYRMKKLNRRHPEGGLSTEMWVLSPVLGDWWRLKAIRVHPEDLPKLSDVLKDGDYRDIRQIIDSPFLPEPIVIFGGDGEEDVDKLIMARTPVAERLRCKPQTIVE